ncbi:hypothetical protein JOC86_002388 [Bacillus pakistanensis]|uniref:Minor capsid protein n=1 Tax=Rossellomorea pakistanensis TaxID=992288 RepID=A0ABS2NDC1_9BACI|nr:putative minor capsid protein [Bacillus pakistanensis]MBM7585846.1 hypothetical protein [Bacillus pakistanensis]
MIRPIPVSLLIHEVTYEEPIPDDGWSEESYKPAITLKNVRVESSSNIKRTNTGEQILYKSLLIVDVVNSSPIPEFKEKSKVTFNGDVMYVNKVNPIHAFTLHHYEIELT